jgi:23S rRNA (uracil1939-C5)-methyltransferase
MLPRLIDLVTGEISGALAWDLYAGVGLFSLPLAEQFEQVVAVEIAQESVASLKKNLTGRGSRLLEQETLSFLRSAGRGARPELIVVDPPRTGLGRPVAELLAKVRAKEIRYLSCDPATLARDLKLLVDSGYCCRKIHFLDLFPRTYHTETLLQLDLR